jgi:hypothetical protein
MEKSSLDASILGWVRPGRWTTPPRRERCPWRSRLPIQWILDFHLGTRATVGRSRPRQCLKREAWCPGVSSMPWSDLAKDFSLSVSHTAGTPSDTGYGTRSPLATRSEGWEISQGRGTSWTLDLDVGGRQSSPHATDDAHRHHGAHAAESISEHPRAPPHHPRLLP